MLYSKKMGAIVISKLNSEAEFILNLQESQTVELKKTFQKEVVETNASRIQIT